MTSAVPTLVVITDRHAAAKVGRPVVDTVAAALDGGAPAVLLRDKDLPADERRTLGEQLRRRCTDAGARLLVSSDVALARDLAADGIHLAAHDPPYTDATLLIGRSCHNRAEVAAARDEGVAYATVSPVAASTSKPGHGPPLGPAGLQRLVTAAEDLPLLALGGVTPDNVAQWWQAHGIAVMGGIMRATDPATTVRALLTAWAERSAPARPTPASEPEDPS
ncbi:MAG: thiamine phosphate synthase [Nitriliruptoraceae bacterium]